MKMRRMRGLWCWCCCCFCWRGGRSHGAGAGVNSCVGDSGVGDGVQAGFHVRGVLMLVLVSLLMSLLVLRPVMALALVLILVFFGRKSGLCCDGVGKVLFLSSSL